MKQVAKKDDKNVLAKKEVAPAGSLVPLAPPIKPFEYPKRQVISEDDYLEGLSRIIRREYYSDLDRLDAQYAYLVALDQQDWPGLLEASRRLDQTPIDDHLGSLEDFQAKHVGDDDASFQTIMETMNQQRSLHLSKLHEISGRLLLKNSEVMLLNYRQQERQPREPLTINRSATRFNLNNCNSNDDPLRHYHEILAEHGKHAGDHHTLHHTNKIALRPNDNNTLKTPKTPAIAPKTPALNTALRPATSRALTPAMKRFVRSSKRLNVGFSLNDWQVEKSKEKEKKDLGISLKKRKS